MSPAQIEALRQEFAGELVLPDDEGYQQARATYVAVGEPVAVLRPRTVDDVVMAIRHCREASLTLSVRSGGHSLAGYGTNTGGLVIDLSAMRAIEVLDPATNLVRIEPGATWGEVARTLQGHGLALTSGDTTSVGVGGLTLAGGIGWMARKYGLTIDSLRAAEVVTADGQILRADATRHEDLFWALRGGGGNFGVVTGFEFTAFPLGRVFAGAIVYPIEQATEVLRGWRDYLRSAPEELNSTAILMPGFGDEVPAGTLVHVCYGGADETAALAAIKPLRELGTAVQQDVQEMDYVDFLEEPRPMDGVRMVVKSQFAADFGDPLIRAVADAARRPGGPVVQVRNLRGAVNRVPADATAFAHRDSEIMMAAGFFVPPDASTDDIRDATGPWRTMTAFGSGEYLGFVNEVTEEDLHAVYPEATRRRLAQIKAEYDPRNLFDQNANIEPAG